MSQRPPTPTEHAVADVRRVVAGVDERQGLLDYLGGNPHRPDTDQTGAPGWLDA
ncbi:hypothetical protein V5P93_002780 [Actinokineospora auranticolor]|uniref:Uncharacterized protein n=1 Tax=Actinokineospora auranticolor TaxID=155976 RepID=A0A2S6H0G7_9PSEU|nr:hypothetical protein [Actinokineospora auranticolor]PPK70921.1 hypothetical protein CLV40_101107 [Actinokineospora auranticolor]